MSRIRTIKPEFWISEQVMNCSHSARLLFIGLWNFCDDGGVHPANIRKLKAEVFPGDDVTLTDVEGWMKELISQKLVAEFTAQYNNESCTFWFVTGWKHQRIDKPYLKYPDYKEQQASAAAPFDCAQGKPLSTSASAASASLSTSASAAAIPPRPFDEHSTTIPRTVEEHSTQVVEGKGKEGKGVEEEDAQALDAQALDTHGDEPAVLTPDAMPTVAPVMCFDSLRLRSGQVAQHKKKQRKRDEPMPDCPDWLNPSIWQQFVEHRKAKRKPLSVRGAEITLRDLARARDCGHDPAVLIETAIAHGWTGCVFADRHYSPNGVATSAERSRGSRSSRGNPKTVNRAKVSIPMDPEAAKFNAILLNLNRTVIEGEASHELH